MLSSFSFRAGSIDTMSTRRLRRAPKAFCIAMLALAAVSPFVASAQIAAKTPGSAPTTASAPTKPPAAVTPIGRWRSIDDATGQAKAVIEVYDAGSGKLSAKIVELIDTSDGPNPLCDLCEGARKRQPILGMVIAWGLKRDGASWSGGRILDPENGKEYSVKMTPIAGGKRLEVRGFLGFSLLGRTQVWHRQTP